VSTAVSQIIFNGRNGDGPHRGRSKARRERHVIHLDLDRERPEPQVTDSRCLCSVCGAVCAVNARACRLHVEKSDDYLICEELIAAGFADVPRRKIPQKVIDTARGIVGLRRMREVRAAKSGKPSWQDWVLGEVPQSGRLHLQPMPEKNESQIGGHAVVCHGFDDGRAALSAARKFAIAAHGNQEYDGKPYRVHLDHVVEVLVRFGIRATPVLEAAWLHDVLEDTSVTADTLRERFGYGPARIVYAVTNEPGANRKERAIKTYPKIRWHGINAVVLKVADRIANTEYSIEHGPAKKLKMYREEFPAFSTALFASGECDSMWDYLRSISTEQPE